MKNLLKRSRRIKKVLRNLKILMIMMKLKRTNSSLRVLALTKKNMKMVGS